MTQVTNDKDKVVIDGAFMRDTVREAVSLYFAPVRAVAHAFVEMSDPRRGQRPTRRGERVGEKAPAKTGED